VATGGATPRVVSTTSQYERDARRLRKRVKDMAALVRVVDDLRNRRRLAPRHRDHALTGDWKRFRECHVEADWLLIYQLDDANLVLVRTGTHADLFE
jgi:mRNA interferase YafQ